MPNSKNKESPYCYCTPQYTFKIHEWQEWRKSEKIKIKQKCWKERYTETAKNLVKGKEGKAKENQMNKCKRSKNWIERKLEQEKEKSKKNKSKRKTEKIKRANKK